MNKEQIEKHDEVIKWFCDNPNKGVCRHNELPDGIWIIDNTPSFDIGYTYVQNDDYAEYRMAQADGKLIRKLVDIHGWINWDSCMFHGDVKNYCIKDKPDESKFKVGDWVRSNRDNKWVKQLRENDLNAFNGLPDYVNLGLEFKLWGPEEGEWCVFWDNNQDEYIVAKYGTTLLTYNGYYDGDYTKEHGWDNIAPLEFIQTLKD